MLTINKNESILFLSVVSGWLVADKPLKGFLMYRFKPRVSSMRPMRLDDEEEWEDDDFDEEEWDEEEEEE